MPFQEDPPRQPNIPPPPPDLATVDVVQIPDPETAQENSQSKPYQLPHPDQDLPVPHVLSCEERLLLTRHTRLRDGTAQGRAKGEFHDKHAPDEHRGGEEGVCILVEGRVLEVVVIQGYEGGEQDEANGEDAFEDHGAGVGEAGVVHEFGGVDH